MSLSARIDEDLKQAMRAKDSLRLESVRAIRGEIIKLAKSGQEGAVNDEAVLQQIKVLIKQRQDAIAMFEKGSRPDLAEKEKAQLVVLQEYLPPALNEAELEEMVGRAIADTGATGMRDMGRVMAAIQEMVRLSGKDADNRQLAAIVKRRLTG